MKKEPVFIFGALMFALGAFVLVQDDFVTGRVVSEIPETVEEEVISCRTVQIPYEEYDTIIIPEEVEEIVLEKVLLTYEIIQQKNPPTRIDGRSAVSSMFIIKNSDSETSEFNISITFSEEGEEPVTYSKSDVLSPGEQLYLTPTYFTPYPLNVDVIYEVIPGYKLESVTKTVVQEIEKTILVQKYRSEEVCD